MNKVYLLEGPDGNRYQATLCESMLPNECWAVIQYANLKESEWWKKQLIGYVHRTGITCTTDELNETFKILAVKNQFVYPSPDIIVHWD